MNNPADKIKSAILEDKDKTIDLLYLISIICFIPTRIVSILRINVTDWNIAYSFHIGIIIILLLLFSFRKKININVKVYFLQIMFYTSMVIGLYIFGYFGNSKLFTIVIPLLSWLFIGRRMVIISFLICILTFLVFAVFYLNDIVDYSFDVNSYISSYSSWLVNGFIIISVTVIIIMVVINLFKSLNKAYSNVLHSEEKYRLLFENMTSAFSIYETVNDKNGKALDLKLIEANPAYEKHINRKITDLRGKTIRELNPEIIDDYMALFLEVAVSGTSLEKEVKSELTSRFLKIKLYSPGKNILALLIDDITEFKTTELALRESEERYRKLAQSTFEGIVYTYNGIIMEANKQYADLMGYESDEIIGLNYSNLVSPDDTEIVLEKIRKKSEEPYEYRGLRKDGKIIYIEVRGKSVFHKGKEMRLAAIRDISDRKTVEISLKTKEKHLEEAQKMAKMGHWHLDIVNQRLEWSDEVFRIFGTTPDKFDGTYSGFLKFIHPKDRERVNKVYMDSLKTRQQYEVNHRIVLDDGSIKYITENCVTNYDENDIPISSLGTIKDVTEITIAQIELEKHKSHLEDLVRARTDEIEVINEELQATNEELYYKNEEISTQKEKLETTLQNLQATQTQLLQSEKMASLGILTAGVAHEINNPLNFIQAGVTGLQFYFRKNGIEQGEKITPLMNGIKEGIKRAANIVKSLNQFSRNSASPTETCDMHAIIDNCLTMLHNQLKNRVEIEKKYTTNEYKLIGNTGKLHQAMLNILANASYAIPEKGTITITTTLKNIMFEIRISDTGCGISEANLKKITDPFFTTKPPGEGTGLGLSITYNIIKEHDGILEYQSEEKNGTTAIIYLPIEDE